MAENGLIGPGQQIRVRVATLMNRSPLNIDENIPGIYPAYFNLPAPTREQKMTIQVIEKAEHHIYLDADRPMMRNEIDAEVLAASVIEGLMASWPMVGKDCRPAFFAASGGWTVESALKELAKPIKEADEIQNHWFQQLLMQADSYYSRAKDTRVITMLHREAAERLGAKREWAFNLDPNKVCPFCSAPVIFNAVICRECKEVINPEAYRRLKAELGSEAVEEGTNKPVLAGALAHGLVEDIKRTTEPQIKSNVPLTNSGIGSVSKDLIDRMSAKTK